MKRIVLAALIGMLAMGTVVYAADSSDNSLSYTDSILEDGSLIYYFDEVAVTLPADWNGKFEIETDMTTATFYHKASRDKWLEEGMNGGILFSMSCSVNHDFAELPDFQYIGFSEESCMNYFLTFPTDMQAYMDDGAVLEEFQQMNLEIDFVKENTYMLGQETPAEKTTGTVSGSDVSGAQVPRAKTKDTPESSNVSLIEYWNLKKKNLQ